MYHIPVCPGCCVNLPKGREEEEQKTDRQISYISRNLSRNLWFFFDVILCLCHNIVGERKYWTMELQGSSLSFFKLADEAEPIDISMRALISFNRDISGFRGLSCQWMKPSPRQ